MTSTRRRAVLRGGPPGRRPGARRVPTLRRPHAADRLIRGAGATFPAPLYEKWSSRFAQAHPDVAIAYDAVGSGEGVSPLHRRLGRFRRQRRRDDRRADRPGRARRADDPGHGRSGLDHLQHPGLAGPLKLPREVLRRHLHGRGHGVGRSRGSPPPIPAPTLPSRTIAVVARLDGSGTTFALTNHLSAISEAWKAKHGAATRIDWPGRTMLMRGNEGVAGRVLQTEYSIGYSELGFAKSAGPADGRALQNAAGEFVAPSIASGEAALAASSREICRKICACSLPTPRVPAPTRSRPSAGSWSTHSYPDEATRAAVADFVRVRPNRRSGPGRRSGLRAPACNQS